MNIDKLNDKEREIVFECLLASLHGPFFPDWEFQTIFGVEREFLHEIEKVWPNVDFEEENISLAILNSMGNMIGYPHGKEKYWSDFISVSSEEIYELINKIKKAPSKNSS